MERDVETGGLQTKHHRRAKEVERNCAERNLSETQSHHNLVVTTPTSSEMVTPTTPGGKYKLALASNCSFDSIIHSLTLSYISIILTLTIG